MRTRTALSVALATMTAASLTFFACSKDKKDDQNSDGLTSEQKADGNKVASATATKIIAGAQQGANLHDQNVRAQLRALYTEAKLQRRQMLALQADQTQDAFDICSYFTKDCSEKLDKTQPADTDGQVCKTTSCSDGKTTDTCTSPSSTAQCGATTYTMSEGTMTTTIGCTKVADKKFNLEISADFAGTLSGGSFSNTKLACKININFPLDFSAIGQTTDSASDSSTATNSDSSEGDVELSCEDGQFSCTLDGQALSCEDMKAAMKEDACSK